MNNIPATGQWLPHINCNKLNRAKKLIIEKFKKNKINGWVKLGDLVEQWQIKTHDIVITDNYLTCDHIPLWPEFYGTYFVDQRYQHIEPSKTVSFFINRTDAFRQSWLYQIVRRNLFNSSHFSYNCFAHPHAFQDNMPITPQEVFEYYYQFNTEFESEHQFLQDKVPMQTFSGDIEQAILDSKVALILETYHDMTHGVAFSEKTFITLQIPRPFLIFSNPRTVEHLRRCGFDCFDDIVDHSYDHSKVEVERQAMILDQVEKIHNLEYDQKLVDRLQQGCNNNTSLLKQLNEAWPAKLQSVLDYLDTFKTGNK
jgi:hypothetical protein